MGKLQLFLNNFYKMTFEGKGAFWGIILALVLLALVYIFAEKLRDCLKKKTVFLLAVPVLLLGCFVLLLVNASSYVPLADRTSAGDASYAWEQTTKKSENTLDSGVFHAMQLLYHRMRNAKNMEQLLMK